MQQQAQGAAQVPEWGCTGPSQHSLSRHTSLCLPVTDSQSSLWSTLQPVLPRAQVTQGPSPRRVLRSPVNVPRGCALPYSVAMCPLWLAGQASTSAGSCMDGPPPPALTMLWQPQLRQCLTRWVHTSQLLKETPGAAWRLSWPQHLGSASQKWPGGTPDQISNRPHSDGEYGVPKSQHCRGGSICERPGGFLGLHTAPCPLQAWQGKEAVLQRQLTPEEKWAAAVDCIEAAGDPTAAARVRQESNNYYRCATSYHALRKSPSL